MTNSILSYSDFKRKVEEALEILYPLNTIMDDCFTNDIERLKDLKLSYCIYDVLKKENHPMTFFEIRSKIPKINYTYQRIVCAIRKNPYIKNEYIEYGGKTILRYYVED